jgi:RND family efflux transporter MFP subunit
MASGRTLFPAVVWLAALVPCVGCVGRNAYHPPPPPKVKVALPVRASVTVFREFSGTTQASESVEIRARVQGYLKKIYFQDGDNVLVGQPLFLIDPAPYQAQLDQAKADLLSKRAMAVRAEAIYKRALYLVRQNASTQEDVDKDKGDWEVAKADIAQGEAKVREAQLNLDFTRIEAPISGRLSRRLIDIGNLVTQDSTLLTTITRYNPMYVYFTVSDAEHQAYLKRRRERPAGSLEAFSVPEPELPKLAASVAGLLLGQAETRLLGVTALNIGLPHYPVYIGLAGDRGYPHRGYIDFSDNTVDSNTGTLQLRGVFRNPPPDYYLAPGYFVRVRVPIGKTDNVLLVPEQALATDQSGKYVLVVKTVDGKEVVELRKLTVGATEGEYRVVESGDLTPDDRVIVDGLQKARPGAVVDPETIALPKPVNH